MPPGWILGTIKRELNLYAPDDDMLKDLQDHTETALDSIILHDFGTYFIMICYASILSQDMSYGIGARQGCIS
jgi:hypothetical protein